MFSEGNVSRVVGAVVVAVAAAVVEAVVEAVAAGVAVESAELPPQADMEAVNAIAIATLKIFAARAMQIIV
jgi:hypothetical protein